MTAPASESLRVDRAELFDEDARGLALDIDLGSEGGGTRASRCGCDDHDGSWQELIGLHDDGEPIAVLFMANTLGRLEPVDVTPEHASTP